MTSDFKGIYIDNSLLVGWVIPHLREEKDPPKPKIVSFLEDHKEVKARISCFSVAELTETFIDEKQTHKEIQKIQAFKRTPENIQIVFDALVRSLGIGVLEETHEGGETGIFLPKYMIEFTGICKQVKDAVHIAIAKHNELYFVTHDKKATRLSSLYKGVITDNHLYKIFNK